MPSPTHSADTPPCHVTIEWTSVTCGMRPHLPRLHAACLAIPWAESSSLDFRRSLVPSHASLLPLCCLPAANPSPGAVLVLAVVGCLDFDLPRCNEEHLLSTLALEVHEIARPELPVGASMPHTAVRRQTQYFCTLVPGLVLFQLGFVT